MDSFLLAGTPRRQRLLVRRQYVEDALDRWDAWEEGGLGAGTLDQTRTTTVAPMPALTRAALCQLRALICEELARLDQQRPVSDVPGALGDPCDQIRPSRYPTPGIDASDFGPE